jgi:hypothetical protein
MSETKSASSYQPEPPLRIRVPFDIAKTDQNTLRRLKPLWQSGPIKAARTAGFRAWLDAGRPQYTSKVRVSITVRRGRRLDATNAIGACKAAMDGLFVGLKVGGVFVAGLVGVRNADPRDREVLERSGRSGVFH